MHIVALLLTIIAGLAAFTSGLLFTLFGGGLAVAGDFGLGAILVRGLPLSAAALLGLIGGGLPLCRRPSAAGVLFAAALLALFPALYALLTDEATGIIQPVVIACGIAYALAGLCARRAARTQGTARNRAEAPIETNVSAQEQGGNRDGTS